MDMADAPVESKPEGLDRATLTVLSDPLRVRYWHWKRQSESGQVPKSVLACANWPQGRLLLSRLTLVRYRFKQTTALAETLRPGGGRFGGPESFRRVKFRGTLP